MLCGQLKPNSKGTVLGAPTEPEVALAEVLTQRLEKAGLIRFTPSGTEANMQAIRRARAYTGKPNIAKCVGAYHGSWDAVPLTSGTPGIPSKVEECTIYFPYNKAEEAERQIKLHRDSLAAVIIEPTMRDMTLKPSFLKTVREATESYNVPLIFDEVISFSARNTGEKLT